MAHAQMETKHTDIEEQIEGLKSILPTTEGCWYAPFFLLQGCWLPADLMKSVTTMQRKFHPCHNDIILATHPKCGTTWLKALAFAIINRSSHPLTSCAHPLLSHNPHDLVPFLEIPSPDLQPDKELDALPSPRLLSTHLPLSLLPSSTLSLGRVVYLCRDPKDVLVSSWYHLNKLSPDFSIEFDTAFEFFCQGFSLFGPIWEHNLGYWNQSKIEPQKVLFLKYNEMIVEPTKHVKMLAEFLHVPFTDEEESSGAVEEVVRLCSFQHLKNLPVNSQGVSKSLGAQNSSFFRTAKVGDWANHLTAEMAKKLDCIVEEKLRGSGLTF